MGIRTGVSALVGYPEAPRPHGTSLIPQKVSCLYISTVLLYYMRIQFCTCSLFFWENAWKGLQVFSSVVLWKPFIRLYKLKLFKVSNVLEAFANLIQNDWVKTFENISFGTLVNSFQIFQKVLQPFEVKLWKDCKSFWLLFIFKSFIRL